nr:MAG TPA: hypothetical protein [Caudoviricetes sp.]
MFNVRAAAAAECRARKKACRTDKLNPKAYKNTGFPKTKGFWEEEKQRNE